MQRGGTWRYAVPGFLARCCTVVALAVFVGVLSGCDGEGTLTIIAPPEQMRGPRVSGQVRLPDGELARASSIWHDMFAMLVEPAHALFSGTVEPVGAGVEVQLVYVDPEEAAAGDLLTDLPILTTANTNDNGQYQLFLPVGTTADRCRYMVQVGNADDGTLTRAFVFRSDGPVDIDFASETVVRQILTALADGTALDLCDFEAADIALLYQAVLALPGTVPGDTIAAVNANADAAASSDIGFQILLEDAGLPGPVPPTRTPTPTGPALSTATFTPTGTRIATATETARPSRTEAATPTRTPTPSATGTLAATASPTTTPPVATATSTVVVPTSTVASPTPTNTSALATATAPLATHTPSATPTQTPSPTATQPTAAALNIGTVSGGPGMTVSVPVTLVGTTIVAVSTDIEFDSEVLAPVLTEGHPDCEAAPALPANKRVVTSIPSIPGLPANRTVVRVGVVGTDNNAPLPAGTLFSCRFAINADAPMGNLTLANTPEASDELGNTVIIDGSDGTVMVTAAPPSLDLDMVVGTVGESFTVSATLHTRGQTISALSTDIAVGTALLDVVLGDDQVPDCVVDDAIGPGTTPDKRVFAAVVPDDSAAAAGDAAGISTEVLRVGVIATANNEPIPDGHVFHCLLGVPAQATPGMVSLTHQPEGSSPTGTTIGLQGHPADITIVQP